MTEKEKLQLHYDNAVRPGTPKALFLGINDYVKCIDSNPGLTEIVKDTVIAERDKGLIELNKLGEALIKESAAMVTKLRELVVARAVKDDGVEKELSDYEGVLEKRIQYSSPLPEAIHDSVRSIFVALDDAGQKELVKSYARFRDGILIGWDFAPSSGPYFSLLKSLREKHDVSVWGHWDELARVHEVIEKKDEIIARLEKENDRMGQMNFYGLVEEMKKVLEGDRAFEPHYFIKEDFSLYLNRVHTFLMSQDPQPSIRFLGEPQEQGVVRASSVDFRSMTQQMERATKLMEANAELTKEVIAEKTKSPQSPERLDGKPEDWCWLNEAKGIYQFGGKRFTQTGDSRKKVFRALMNIYATSPGAVSVASLNQMTGLAPARIRIEISAINQRLKSEVGHSFQGSGEGFYVLR